MHVGHIKESFLCFPASSGISKITQTTLINRNQFPNSKEVNIYIFFSFSFFLKFYCKMSIELIHSLHLYIQPLNKINIPFISLCLYISPFHKFFFIFCHFLVLCFCRYSLLFFSVFSETLFSPVSVCFPIPFHATSFLSKPDHVKLAFSSIPTHQSCWLVPPYRKSPTLEQGAFGIHMVFSGYTAVLSPFENLSVAIEVFEAVHY